MEILRKQNERMSKQVADLTAENKRLVEPLKKALADVTEYQRLLRNYEKDKLSLVVLTLEKTFCSIRSLNFYVSEHQSQIVADEKRTERPEMGERSVRIAL